MKSPLRIRVPATSANLGPGFDAFALALALYNTVTVEPITRGLEVIVTGEGEVPRDETNLVISSMKAGFELARQKMPPLRVRLDNQIPIGRGLGSSAAAIVGGLVMANRLMGNQLSAAQLLAQAIEIEGHPDNVAGALFGGLVVIAQSGAEWRWAKIRPPRDLWAVVFIPTHGLSTKFARSLIPTEIPRSDAVFNLARTGLLVHAFHARDYSLLRMAMQDRLHQPYREPVIPGLRAMIDAAEKAGAVGAALSGAGPGVLALANGKVAKIARAMKQAAQRAKIMGVVRILALSAQGAL